MAFLFCVNFVDKRLASVGPKGDSQDETSIVGNGQTLSKEPQSKGWGFLLWGI
ncbi:Uncharacterised protein [Hafnia alvei]|nr:Uncharacterised protein [Hafnia alvei]